jgi:hypothetical protein
VPTRWCGADWVVVRWWSYGLTSAESFFFPLFQSRCGVDGRWCVVLVPPFSFLLFLISFYSDFLLDYGLMIIGLIDVWKLSGGLNMVMSCCVVWRRWV